MNRISIELCKKLIGNGMTEDELHKLTEMVYVLADAVADCFSALDNIDQRLLCPPGDVIDCLNEMEILR